MKAFKKVTNKISNSKIIKNPVFLLIGLIVIILVIALIYFIFLKYSPIMNFKYEGYAISGKDITENLLGSSEDSTINKNLELAKIEEQGTIFKKLNDYFVGNKEKTEINLNYPIYINENSAIYNLAENSTLISKDFEEIAGYPNLSIAQGKVYDGNNLERADAKEYIFVKTSDDIFINLYEIKIKTTANEYTIPVNSIVAFNENTIRYYSVNNNILVFNEINDVDSDSDVQMVEKSYTYEELLINLGILQKQPTNTENNETQPNIIQEDSANLKAEENETDEVEQDKTEETEETEQEEAQNGYIKPEVSVEDFTAKSTLTIKDPSGRIIEAPTFEIYKDGKIYLRRTFSNSGDIQITGLIPDTEYEIVGKYVYLNENGQKVENTFYEGTFTTKGYDEYGKEYETVLGSDGKIYDLKEPIEYPENFLNSDIESIGNNLNSDKKEVEVTYKNGDKIKFNYQTGAVISSSKAEDAEKTGLFDYLKEKISEIGNSNSGVAQEITNKYEASKELQTKLEETSVEEAIEKQNIANSEQGTEGVTTTENNVTNNSLTEDKYISVYDEKTDDYLIYNEEELLDTTKEEVVSENEKIEANNLSEYYASEGKTKNTKMGIVWIVISIIGVGITLFVLGKKIGIRGRC